MCMLTYLQRHGVNIDIYIYTFYKGKIYIHNNRSDF